MVVGEVSFEEKTPDLKQLTLGGNVARVVRTVGTIKHFVCLLHRRLSSVAGEYHAHTI